MRFRRCGSASEAWKAKASRTSRERRPTEGPQRTSSGDALGSPERPRPSVARQNRPHRETGTTVKARGAKPAAGRQMSRRWTFSPQDRTTLPPQQSGEKLATLLEHPPSPSPHQQQHRRGHGLSHHSPCTTISAAHLSAQRGGARCGSDGVGLRAEPGGRERAEPRVSEGPWRGRSERPAETRWAPPSDHAQRPKAMKRGAKPAAGRQMSRRWTFSPHDQTTLPPQQSGEKLATLLEHPPSPPPR